MNPDTIMRVIELIVPGIAAYVSVRIGITQALEKANQAYSSAERAHIRIDDILANQIHYTNQSKH